MEIKIKGYEKYAVSTKGEVFSFCQKKKRRMKYYKNKDGYYRVGLWKEGEGRKTILVHRLVALSFLPNKEGKNEVNHRNGIKTDNRVKNLEWSTRSENISHAYRKGLIDSSTKGRRGEKNVSAKLTEKEVREIRKINGKTQKEIAVMFGVTRSLIGYIKSKKIWKYI